MAEALLGAPWSRGPLFTHLSPPDPLLDGRALLVPMTFPGSSKAPARHKCLEQRVSPVTPSGVLMGLRRGPRKPSSSRVSSHRVKGEETGVEQEAGRQRSGQAGRQRSGHAGGSSAERAGRRVVSGAGRRWVVSAHSVPRFAPALCSDLAPGSCPPSPGAQAVLGGGGGCLVSPSVQAMPLRVQTP